MINTANRRSKRTPTRKARINSVTGPSNSLKKKTTKNNLKKTNNAKKDNIDPKMNFNRREWKNKIFLSDFS